VSPIIDWRLLLVPFAMPMYDHRDPSGVTRRRYIYLFGIRVAVWTVP